MRGEIILLAAGLAVVAGLPVEELKAPSQDDLSKIIHSANPQENDIGTTVSKDSVVPTKTEEMTQTETERPQSPSQPQDTLHVQKQMKDKEQIQFQSQDQPQLQAQDTPQKQQQLETEDKATSQIQSQSQEPQPDSNEEPSPVYESDETSNEDLQAVVRPRPQPKLVYPEENYSNEFEKNEEGSLNSGREIETFSDEAENEFVAQHENDEMSTDTENYSEYNAEVIPFNQEEEQFLPGTEPQGETLPHDIHEELFPFDMKTDYFPSNPEGLIIEPVSDQTYGDLHTDVSGESFDSDPYMHSFSPYETEEGFSLLDDYDYFDYVFPTEYQPENDYEFPNEKEQLESEEDLDLIHMDEPLEKSHEKPIYDSTLEFLRWLVPDYEEGVTDYDEPLYTSDYSEDMMDEDFINKPEMPTEPWELEHTSDWNEPSTPDVLDDTGLSTESFLENKDIAVGDTMMPTVYENKEGDNGDVSLADFYIPNNDDQEYSENNSEEDNHEERVPHEQENFLIDDGLFLVKPPVQHDQLDAQDGDILFSENPSSREEKPMFLWPSENDENQMDDTPLIILESQPTYVADGNSDGNHPSLLGILKRETVRENVDDIWNGGKSKMFNALFDIDDEKLVTDGDYSLKTPANNRMSIIVLKDIRQNSNNFPFTFPDEDLIPRGPRMPTTTHTVNRHSRPYWVPHESPNKFSQPYFPIHDEFQRRKIPAFFDYIDDNLPFLDSMPHHMKRSDMRVPSTYENEVMYDDLSSQQYPSPRKSHRFDFMGPHSMSLSNSFSHEFSTPKFSFHDFLHQITPSNGIGYGNMAKRNLPPFYPDSYYEIPHHRDFPRQIPYKSSHVVHSAPLPSFYNHDYSPVPDYYMKKSRAPSFYMLNDEPSHLFQENPMTGRYPRQSKWQFNDYTDNLPFMSKNSFSGPQSNSNPFHFYPKPQYSVNSVIQKRSYNHNPFYDMGPYQPKSMYPRYDTVY